MATKKFKVNYYRACVGYKNSATWGGVNIQIQGYITCYGDDGFRFIMYFLHEDSLVPDPVYIVANKVGAIFIPFKEMPVYIDMIRNEKPIWALPSRNGTVSELHSNR